MTVHSPEARHGRASADDRAAKRERILEAAERVFALRGFYAAKVADIAREAGVADGTIYLYFKSKDDLLISLFESRIVRVNQILAAAINLKMPALPLGLALESVTPGPDGVSISVVGQDVPLTAGS